jgi:hypothetical protein
LIFLQGYSWETALSVRRDLGNKKKQQTMVPNWTMLSFRVCSLKKKKKKKKTNARVKS